MFVAYDQSRDRSIRMMGIGTIKFGHNAHDVQSAVFGWQPIWPRCAIRGYTRDLRTDSPRQLLFDSMEANLTSTAHLPQLAAELAWGNRVGH